MNGEKVQDGPGIDDRPLANPARQRQTQRNGPLRWKNSRGFFSAYAIDDTQEQRQLYRVAPLTVREDDEPEL